MILILGDILAVFISTLRGIPAIINSWYGLIDVVLNYVGPLCNSTMADSS